MSASPRKLLRRALDALVQVNELLGRYPEARADLARRLGPELFSRTMRTHDTLAEAVTALDTDRPDGESDREHSG